ncbi:MAG: two-component regulator propeller domain-containing protein [Candidatus Eisenbacteria bacterium]|nr:two-component regulator propeller domain-containing protein [Candidatus Eisenbacteria bacterium]
MFLAAPGGDQWIAAFAGLARLRDGRLERIFPQSGLPSDQTRPLFLDSRSRLWLGHRFGGVSVTDDPQAGHPVFRNYSEEDGLSSATVWAIAEDDSGRIYLGTSRGLDRLDPDTGTVQHYGVSDGLAGDSVNDALRDREGRIWLGTSGGISRFDPSLPEPAPLPPPIYLSSVQAGGEDLFLPDHGLVALEGIRIGPRPANLEVSFVGLSFRGERTLRYSYRLEGDPMSEEWSAPTAQRTVLFSRLMPGRYRFEVRAITRQGIESPLPARVELEVLPPLWRQAWFLGLLVAAGLALSLIHI